MRRAPAAVAPQAVALAPGGSSLVQFDRFTTSWRTLIVAAVGSLSVAGAVLWSLGLFRLGSRASTEKVSNRRARLKAERREVRQVERGQLLIVLQDVLRAVDAGEENPLKNHAGLSLADLEAMAAPHRDDTMVWAHWEAIAASQLAGTTSQVGRKRAAGRGRRGKRPERPVIVPAAVPDISCASIVKSQPQGSAGTSIKTLQRQLKLGGPGDGSRNPEHELFAFSLPKAQGVSCLALGCRRPLVAAACGDCTVKLYDVTAKSSCIVVRVEGGDRMSYLDFSPDDDRLFGVLNSLQEIRSFKVGVGEPASLKAAAVGRWAGVALAAKDRGDVQFLRSRVSRAWLLTAAGEGQTAEVRIWSPEGALLHTFDTKQIRSFNFSMSSPPLYVPGVQRICLAGIVSSTTSPGVKVKVLRQQKEDFVEFTDCMRLKSPKTTRAVCFTPDGSRAVVSLEGGGLQLWDIAVRYQDGEAPKLLRESTSPSKKTCDVLNISHDGRVLGAAFGEDIEILDLETLEQVATIAGAHAAVIAELYFTADGKHLATRPVSGRPAFWQVPPMPC